MNDSAQSCRRPAGDLVLRAPALIGLTLYWQALTGRRPELTGFERTTLTGY